MAEKKKEAPQEKPAGSKLKWIILLVVLLLVLGAGGGAAYYFLVYKAGDQGAEGEHAEEGAGHAASPAEGHGGDAGGAGHGGEGGSHAGSSQAPPIYHDLEPFTVNMAASGPVRFLRLKVTIVTRDPAVIAALDKHMPMIRNDLLSLLGNQDQASLNTREGKDALRQELKKSIADALLKVREPSWVDEILFTDFVMQ